MLLRVALFLCCTVTPLAAQHVALPRDWARDSAALERSMPGLARALLARLPDDGPDATLNNRFRLQFVAGEFEAGLATLAELRRLRAPGDPLYSAIEYTQYEIVARAALASTAAARTAASVLARLDDRAAFRVEGSFRYDLARSAADLERQVAPYRDADSMPLRAAIGVVRQFHVHTSYARLLPGLAEVLTADQERRYVIEDSVIVPVKDGATVSAIVVRPRGAPALPAVLSFTIYADENNLLQAREIAAHGYAGVVANTRGKRWSAGPVVPFEHDGSDANDVIDWISRQPWNNGKVGMLGGSYAGWTQWAAAMRLHPALKTIVPSAAIVPGLDTPLENGIYISWQYPWVGYTTNNRLLDDEVYRDRDRWWRLDSTWYASGVAYRALDSIDGTPNPLWHRWISHPTYDAFWQRLSPQGQAFARIDIPVLTTTGYFDGAQVGALHYLREHTRHNRKAPHYLLIGPWDHFGAQGRPAPFVSGYRIDRSAQLDISGIIYQWFDHTLKGAPRPAALANRINFQVMGADRWEHASSLESMAKDTLSFYLRRSFGSSGARVLGRTPGPASEATTQVIDFRDRSRSTTNAIPGQLADTVLNLTNAVVFASDPLTAPVTIAGAFTGVLDFVTNKRDMDVGITLYEERADGTWFHLSYYLGRLSLARDPTKRMLLVRGGRESIPFTNTRMISKVLEKGSRIVVLLNINQSPENPVNYGSGKDVYAETMADAGEPLQVEWRATSEVRIPID